MKVLDLDMDYFMDCIAHTPFNVCERLNADDYGSSVWTETDVREFFEVNFDLSI